MSYTKLNCYYSNSPFSDIVILDDRFFSLDGDNLVPLSLTEMHYLYLYLMCYQHVYKLFYNIL